MEYTPLKKKNRNRRNKSKLKGKNRENKEQGNFVLKIIFKTIFIFIFILFDTISILHLSKTFFLFDENKAFHEILSFEKNINFSEDIFYEFLEINEQNKLIEDNIKFEKFESPDISVVMLIYNQAHCLHRCLRSIQNQSLKNIEIIIVDDCSLDNSVELIKEYQKEDPRIILKEHDANRGMIKARTDGARIAKGKYITSIDGDDAFIHKDILKNSLYIAEKGNLDIVEFSKYIFYGGRFKQKSYEFPELNLSYIIKQPELRTKFIWIDKFNNYHLINEQIIGKLIKNKLYKKAMKYVGKRYTEDYINRAEDRIFIVSFFHLANSYYLMKEIGYLYYKGKKVKYSPNEKSKKCKVIDKIKDFDHFKFTKFLVENTGNNLKEQMVAYNQITSLNFFYQINNKKMEKRHFKIMLKILDKSSTFEFLSQEKKEYIMKIKNKILEIKRDKQY